jgi:hypothetical protein
MDIAAKYDPDGLRYELHVPMRDIEASKASESIVASDGAL